MRSRLGAIGAHRDDAPRTDKLREKRVGLYGNAGYPLARRYFYTLMVVGVGALPVLVHDFAADCRFFCCCRRTYSLTSDVDPKIQSYARLVEMSYCYCSHNCQIHDGTE